MRALGLCVLAGCVEPGPFGSHPPPMVLGVPAFASVSLVCAVDDDRWTLDAETTAWSGGAESSWTEDGEYVESHDVPVVASEPDGSSDALELDLPIVSDWRDAGAGSTVFTCGDAPAVTVTLLDRSGDPVDCRWFADPTAEPAACPTTP